MNVEELHHDLRLVTSAIDEGRRATEKADAYQDGVRAFWADDDGLANDLHRATSILIHHYGALREVVTWQAGAITALAKVVDDLAHIVIERGMVEP